MATKCVHKRLLEERAAETKVEGEAENKCNRCFGYETTCPNYTDLAHLMNFYELFKQDKSQDKWGVYQK